MTFGGLPARGPRPRRFRYRFSGRPDLGSRRLLCAVLLSLRLRGVGMGRLPRRGQSRPDLPVPRHPDRPHHGDRPPRRRFRTATTRRPLQRLPGEKAIGTAPRHCAYSHPLSERPLLRRSHPCPLRQTLSGAHTWAPPASICHLRRRKRIRARRPRIDAQLHKYGGQVPRVTEPG